MDKGLKILEELQLKLTDLELEEQDNRKSLNFEYDNKKDIKLRINISQKKLNKLKILKTKYEEVPTKRKQQKKSFIKIMIIELSILMSLMTIIGVGFGNLIPILEMTFVIGGLGCLGTGSFLYFVTKPKYSHEYLSEIESKIKQQINHIENLKTQEKAIDNRITNLREIHSHLKKQIDEVVKKINSIQKVRSDVIDDYLKDNKELDNLLDSAYDNQIENSKQKPKK